jgi:hypothetical protein
MNRILFATFIVMAIFGCNPVEKEEAEEDEIIHLEFSSVNEPELVCEFLGQRALPNAALYGYCISNVVIMMVCDRSFKECIKTKKISKCNKEKDRCIDMHTDRDSDIIRYNEKQCYEKCHEFLPYPGDCVQQKIDNPRFICLEARSYCMSMCNNGYL